MMLRPMCPISTNRRDSTKRGEVEWTHGEDLLGHTLATVESIFMRQRERDRSGVKMEEKGEDRDGVKRGRAEAEGKDLGGNWMECRASDKRKLNQFSD